MTHASTPDAGVPEQTHPVADAEASADTVMIETVTMEEIEIEDFMDEIFGSFFGL
ncbi:hypothetical protein [Methylobacterium sp. WCS2018Hpa-22]|uniref:hypothetical protein n=1 Tax=Methylobacterium sp. WCS2018Hpa-22 TaxID=3073633 RepID=UPI00288A28EC|nr:hypothetical protein [Methylobacterium sp. WCS2018Hpa-22]